MKIGISCDTSFQRKFCVDYDFGNENFEEMFLFLIIGGNGNIDASLVNVLTSR